MNDSMYAPQEVDLPSRGLAYEETNPLSKGVVELKIMSAKEEDILTNINFLKKGVALDKMLQSLLVTKIDYSSLLVADKSTLLIAARILAYGKDYQFIYELGDNGPVKVTVDLTSLKEKEFNTSIFKNKNEFDFVLPASRIPVTFKLLTHGDSVKIDAELNAIQSKVGQSKGIVTTTLKYQLTSVNGEKDTKTIREFVDSDKLLSRDSISLRNFIVSITPETILKADAVTDDGTVYHEIDIPITSEFFFPGSGL